MSKLTIYGSAADQSNVQFCVRVPIFLSKFDVYESASKEKRRNIPSNVKLSAFKDGKKKSQFYAIQKHILEEEKKVSL